MPELPEVETVCRNLREKIKCPANILKWSFYRKDLRFYFQIKKLESLKKQRLLSIERRAKFIVFKFENDFLISHLGMSGQWRFIDQGEKLIKHDHVQIYFSDGEIMVYNDPRRFGFLLFYNATDYLKYFNKFGVEPLELTTKYDFLITQFKSLRTNIKSALMNQKYIVGIGNIYACEILFLAGVRPNKRCDQIKKEKYIEIFRHTTKVISEAISSGGSSIKSYKNSFGESGHFQKKLFVYGRESEPCHNCRAKILNSMISNRSSFYCPVCQK